MVVFIIVIQRKEICSSGGRSELDNHAQFGVPHLKGVNDKVVMVCVQRKTSKTVRKLGLCPKNQCLEGNEVVS